MDPVIVAALLTAFGAIIVAIIEAVLEKCLSAS